MTTSTKRLAYFGLIAVSISIIIPTIAWLKILDGGNRISSTSLAEFATFQTFILSAWGLLLNVLLVILAYKAFKNFGVKEQYHNKQLSLVTDLATEVTSTILSNMMHRIVLDPKGTEHKIAEGYTFSFF